MKIHCHCGHMLIDSTDGHPHKGYLIPDQDWDKLFDSLDLEVICPARRKWLTEEAASMTARLMISNLARILYQCSECGRIYINDHNGQLHSYLPEDEQTSREILRSHE